MMVVVDKILHIKNDDSSKIDKENKNLCGTSCQEMTTHQYAEAYRNWLYQQQFIHQLNMAQFNLFSMFSVFNYNVWMNASRQSQSVSSQQQTQQNVSDHQPSSPLVTNVASSSINTPRRNGRQCQIPPLWMRFVAEIVDFFILFILKIMGTIIIFDYIDIIDVDSQNFDKLINMNWDIEMAQNITSDLILFELINRLFVSVFEALFLRRGTMSEIGGSTPGKKMFGLKVISCQDVVRLDNKRIIVYPAKDLNMLNSLLRSILKNFSYIFFMPMPLTAFVFPFNRTAYDVISQSIVVLVDDNDARQFRRGP